MKYVYVALLLGSLAWSSLTHGAEPEHMRDPASTCAFWNSSTDYAKMIFVMGYANGVRAGLYVNKDTSQAMQLIYFRSLIPEQLNRGDLMRRMDSYCAVNPKESMFLGMMTLAGNIADETMERIPRSDEQNHRHLSPGMGILCPLGGHRIVV